MSQALPGCVLHLVIREERRLTRATDLDEDQAKIYILFGEIRKICLHHCLYQFHVTCHQRGRHFVVKSNNVAIRLTIVDVLDEIGEIRSHGYHRSYVSGTGKNTSRRTTP